MLISKAFKTEVAAAVLMLTFAASAFGGSTRFPVGEFAQQISQLCSLERPANSPHTDRQIRPLICSLNLPTGGKL